MRHTPGEADVIATIDEVLDALATYPERDAAIELLELRINADRQRVERVRHGREHRVTA